MLKAIIAAGIASFILFAGAARADPVRGEYLALAADCKSCHTQEGHGAFGGGREMKTPFGAIYSTNITPDPDYGVGKYTFQDFDRAVRHGVAKDGHHLYPAMPYPSFRKMSDEDVRDLYDYFLHAVPAVHETGPKTQLPFPFNMRWFLIFWNWLCKPHHLFKPQPEHDAVWNRGAYLVETLGHCGACHTPRGIIYQERGMTATSATYLTGGTLEYWHAPPLRQNATVGLQAWSEADIASFLKTGRARNVMAFGAMSEVVEASTQYLTDDDRVAIARYLKSLPPGPAGSLAPSYNMSAQEMPGAGRYAQFCSGCHGATGLGGKSAPALAGNPAVLTTDPSSVVHMMLKGGRSPMTGDGPNASIMPGFEKTMDDREAAEVATFVRQSWGNRAPTVSPGLVKSARHALRKDAVMTPPPTDRPVRATGRSP